MLFSMHTSLKVRFDSMFFYRCLFVIIASFSVNSSVCTLGLYVMLLV